MSAYTAYWKFTQLGNTLKIYKNKINTKVSINFSENKEDSGKENESATHVDTFKNFIMVLENLIKIILPSWNYIIITISHY